MRKTIKLMSRIKEKLNKWKEMLYSWIGRPNIAKILVPSNLIYGLNPIPIKILGSYFVHIEKLISKSKWKTKDPKQPEKY